MALGVNVSDISKIINDQLEKPVTHNAFKYFIKHDDFWFKDPNGIGWYLLLDRP